MSASRFCQGLLIFILLTTPATATPLELPWRQAGMTERQAAAHLLDRFAYGARPGDVDRVVEMGLDAWVERQLRGGLDDPEVAARLHRFRTLDLSPREASEIYPQPFLVLLQAERAGVVDRRDVERLRAERDEEGADRREMYELRREVIEWARRQGYRPMRELLGEMMAQKLYRAVYSENQLTEVLVDFWFNHFNVSITDNEGQVYVAAYERDAIRPHVLGRFRAMLEATAKHPAMLHYLDNVRSVAEEGAPTTLDRALSEWRWGRFGGGPGRRPYPRFARGDDELRRLIEERRPTGLNENYARELLELHTLGVDGGYDQDDVVEVARALTGWATYPPAVRRTGLLRREVEQRIERARRLPARAGFVFEESFLFRADAHDAGAKTILGRVFPAGRGIEDGLEVLDALAAHPSTARHLAAKLAARFVADEPPPALVDRLALRFRETDGDLEEVMRALVESPEFWSAEARVAKIKSPFELAASALRALDADLGDPREVVEWIARMGQPLYAYQAPTGYGDDAATWVNSGALLQRMSFGLELATGRLAGVRLDLTALNGRREPESLAAALADYLPLLLPGRDPAATLERLEPMARDPELARGFHPDPSPLAHVVGVILGSPEFQRR